MSFYSDLLLDFAAYGFRTRRRWVTTRTGLRSGRVNRNGEVTRPKLFFIAPYDRIKPEHYERLESEFDVCQGGLHSFRFRDKQNHTLDNVVLGTATGATDETMQIIKPSRSFGGNVFNRIITKPADSTKYTIANGYEHNAAALTLTEDTGGGPVNLAFTVDYDTGIVTFTSSAGAIIRCSGEFHVPVFFADDELDFELTTYQAHSTQITLEEDFAA